MFRQYVIRNGYAKMKGIPARAIKTVQGKIWAVYGGFIDKMGIPAGMLFIFYPNQQGFCKSPKEVKRGSRDSNGQ